MPDRQEHPESVAARHAREHREDVRLRRSFWARVLAGCVAWAAVGLLFGAYAFHTADPELGRIALLTGEVVTLVGVLGTLTWAARRRD